MLLKKLNIAATLVDHRRRKREEERERKRAFLENGGLVLEKLVASCNGRPIPIRTFSYQQLILATNNFDHRFILYESCAERIYKMYKGSFEGRILSIKVYDERDSFAKDLALMDIGISAKASAHKNILKLVGCCLETSIPSLVFEYAQNGVLADQIYISKRQGTPMLWQSRLKIARQIAHAIAYLHTGFSRPIIHRDIRQKNILLDQHDVPKLSDFSLSISIPEGETHVVTDILIGTMGFMCPSYIDTLMVTEKTDVFSFGMVLLRLLIGQHPFDYLHRSEDEYQPLKVHLSNHAMNEIVDPAILAEEGGAGLEQQLQAVRQLGLTCIEDDPEIRPTMVDVTKELRRIERSIA
ncbi:serine/threonine-protein kinase ZRK1-like [Alnus glutinosa]|uniref:serine/threonine-protein kinase ZRK1-like n=1 Tax=Alnus glutinosa TaxID=3517 RepID=UPI002D799F3C|nr:serine/threonine-protein kinase ZRK1-like [Alnus glutinosa]